MAYGFSKPNLDIVLDNHLSASASTRNNFSVGLKLPLKGGNISTKNDYRPNREDRKAFRDISKPITIDVNSIGIIGGKVPGIYTSMGPQPVELS